MQVCERASLILIQKFGLSRIKMKHEHESLTPHMKLETWHMDIDIPTFGDWNLLAALARN